MDDKERRQKKKELRGFLGDRAAELLDEDEGQTQDQD